MNQMQGGGSQGDELRQIASEADVGRRAEDHLPRRRGGRRGGPGTTRDQGVPGKPEEVPGARRPDPEGRAALRSARHRQDPARPRRRRRGGRAVLLDLRLGLRRDVRRRRRQPRPRPLRAGEAELPLHHLHGRDRRRRPPPRRRHGRRPRRARADAEPAPRRDGRLRDEGQHHPDRRHEPAGHPRPGAAPARPLRPPDRRRPPRPPRPQEDPRGAHPRQATRQGHRTRHARRPDPGLHRRRPRQPDQRVGPAHRALLEARDLDGRARGGDHARDRGPREEDAGDVREGAPESRHTTSSVTRSSATSCRTATRSTRSRSSAAARPSATRSRCRPRTSSSRPAPSSPTRWR